MLPKIAAGRRQQAVDRPHGADQALRGIGNALGGADDARGVWSPGPPEDGGGNGSLAGQTVPSLAEATLEDPAEALRRARAEVAGAEGAVAESRLTEP